MSWKLTQSTDGGFAIVDNVSGRTAKKFYANGGTHKELTAAYTVTEAENGTTYYLNSTTEFVTTLPSPFLGAEYEFIVKGAPSGASYTVVTASSANIIKGVQTVAEVTAAGAADSGTADDTITFADGQAVAGDRVILKSDGTSWFAHAISKVVAGITFTQAST